MVFDEYTIFVCPISINSKKYVKEDGVNKKFTVRK